MRARERRGQGRYSSAEQRGRGVRVHGAGYEGWGGILYRVTIQD